MGAIIPELTWQILLLEACFSTLFLHPACKPCQGQFYFLPKCSCRLWKISTLHHCLSEMSVFICPSSYFLYFDLVGMRKQTFFLLNIVQLHECSSPTWGQSIMCWIWKPPRGHTGIHSFNVMDLCSLGRDPHSSYKFCSVCNNSSSADGL